MEILIALDLYDDIFSDFDIRGFNERTISRDFLDEMSLRMSRMPAKDKLRVVFVLPREQRVEHDEVVIVNRIKRFFSYRHTRYRQKDKKVKWRSILFFAIGLALLAAANFVHHLIPSIFNDFLLIPSWFFVWSGLEQFLGSRDKLKKKKHYYEVLSNARYEFRDK